MCLEKFCVKIKRDKEKSKHLLIPKPELQTIPKWIPYIERGPRKTHLQECFERIPSTKGGEAQGRSGNGSIRSTVEPRGKPPLSTPQTITLLHCINSTYP